MKNVDNWLLSIVLSEAPSLASVILLMNIKTSVWLKKTVLNQVFSEVKRLRREIHIAVKRSRVFHASLNQSYASGIEIKGYLCEVKELCLSYTYLAHRARVLSHHQHYATIMLHLTLPAIRNKVRATQWSSIVGSYRDVRNKSCTAKMNYIYYVLPYYL